MRTGRISERDLIDRLEARGFRLRPIEGMPSFLQVEAEPWPIPLTLEHWAGLFYVQQASTGVAVPLLGPRPGERVLDLCAAPGGKTTHAAELMEDRGCLVAVEISEPRIRGLLGNVYRLGHTVVLGVAGDGTALPEGARFDRVLVDAPCSGEGTLRKRSGRPPRPSESFRAYATGVQGRLLSKAIRLTRPGGTILYVTCTFAPEENEAVVDAALREEPVRLEPLSPAVPHAPGLTAFEGRRFAPELEGAVRLYPHHLDSGGLFIARLGRLEDGGSAAREEGWGPVPLAFPGETASEPEARESWARASEGLEARFGLGDASLAGTRPILRGGRFWMHSLEEWPLDAWEGDACRPVSVGFRAVEIERGGLPRPTNDLLRWASTEVRSGVVDLDRSELRSLLAEGRAPASGSPPGPLAVRHEGEVLGRVRVSGEELLSEIPKARAADLVRALQEPSAGSG